jgi:hypothetical protein
MHFSKLLEQVGQVKSLSSKDSLFKFLELNESFIHFSSFKNKDLLHVAKRRKGLVQGIVGKWNLRWDLCDYNQKYGRWWIRFLCIIAFVFIIHRIKV